MKHLTLAAFALAPLPCFAYGGFPADATDGELFGGLLRTFLIGLPWISLPWIAGSILVERTTGLARLVSVLLTIVVANALALPQFVAMGTFGNPHLVVPILMKGHLAFTTYFVGKCLWIWGRQRKETQVVSIASEASVGTSRAALRLGKVFGAVALAALLGYGLSAMPQTMVANDASSGVIGNSISNDKSERNSLKLSRSEAYDGGYGHSPSWRRFNSLEEAAALGRRYREADLMFEASFCRDEGDYEGHLRVSEEAIAFAPDNSLNWSGRALAWIDLNQPQKAIADCDKAIELDPSNYNAWTNRGIARVKSGDRAGALSDFDKANSIRWNDPTNLMERGLVRFMLGEFQYALQDFTWVIEGRPDDPSQHPYAALLRWMVRAKMVGRPEADAQLREFIAQQAEPRYMVYDVDPMVQEWADALVGCALRKVTRDELFKLMERQPKGRRNGRRCEAHFYLGYVALVDGREAEALENFEAAVSTGEVAYMEHELAKFELEEALKRR